MSENTNCTACGSDSFEERFKGVHQQNQKADRWEIMPVMEFDSFRASTLGSQGLPVRLFWFGDDANKATATTQAKK